MPINHSIIVIVVVVFFLVVDEHERKKKDKRRRRIATKRRKTSAFTFTLESLRCCSGNNAMQGNYANGRRISSSSSSAVLFCFFLCVCRQKVCVCEREWKLFFFLLFVDDCVYVCTFSSSSFSFSPFCLFDRLFNNKKKPISTTIVARKMVVVAARVFLSQLKLTTRCV